MEDGGIELTKNDGRKFLSRKYFYKISTMKKLYRAISKTRKLKIITLL